MLQEILSVFVSNAYADAAVGPEPQGGGLSFIVMFVIFFVFVYFAIWRPQNKRAKEQRSLLESLAKGDEVVTAGGMLGRLSKISDHYVTLAVNGTTEIVMQKSAVVSVLPKGTLKSIE